MNRRRHTYLLLTTTLILPSIWLGHTWQHQQHLKKTLIAAVDSQNPAAVTAALDRGASPNLHDERGNTILMRAIGTGSESIAALLLRRGADVNASGADGLTALMWAARIGSAESVALLVEHGANPEARNVFGDTALTMFETEPLRSPVAGERHDKIRRLLMPFRPGGEP